MPPSFAKQPSSNHTTAPKNVEREECHQKSVWMVCEKFLFRILSKVEFPAFQDIFLGIFRIFISSTIIDHDFGIRF